MNASEHSRAKVDVINFWCVAVLIISAASVAGVVGAAVITGEFEDRGLDLDGEDDDTAQPAVITIENPDGSTRIRWSEEGNANSLEIRVDGERVETLDFIGDEATIDSGSYEVVALYADGSEETIESRG